EILILDPTATDATDATHYRSGGGQNGLLNEGINSSDSGQSSINCEPQCETEAVAAQIDPITEHANHEDGVNNNNNNNSNSINRNDILDTENSEKEACLSSKCVASVASVADIHDTNGQINEETAHSLDTSVASVADFHKTNIAPTSADDKGEVIEINSPSLPCPWCDHKEPIEFDLGNHLLEHHKGELLKLPTGKGSMDRRIDYVIQQTKTMMAAQYDDEDTESNCDD
ncbi:MAG TPA: hypothetical protein VH796_07835, partial [Nitrososphaeraceae archaeon]